MGGKKGTCQRSHRDPRRCSRRWTVPQLAAPLLQKQCSMNSSHQQQTRVPVPRSQTVGALTTTAGRYGACHVMAILLAPVLTGCWRVAESSVLCYRMTMSSGSRWMTARQQQQQQQQRSRPQTSRSQRRQWHRAQCPSRAAQQQPQLRRMGPRSMLRALLQQIKLPNRQATS